MESEVKGRRLQKEKRDEEVRWLRRQRGAYEELPPLLQEASLQALLKQNHLVEAHPPDGLVLQTPREEWPARVLL